MNYKKKFLKPGEVSSSQSSLDRKDIYELEQPPVYVQNFQDPFEVQRRKLPIFKYRDQIIYLLEKYQVVIILGETGCGKSTQIPQYLLEAGWASNGMMIGITQPRRVAAKMLASRVAEEQNTLVGDYIGYNIRFEDFSNPSLTKIKFMTEGILINEMMSDPLLRNYSVLVLDEIHERSLNCDILLGLLKKILKKRTDLKLVLSSATIEAETMFKFFNKNETEDKSKDTAFILSVEGRNYPVDIFYSNKPVPDYVKASVETVIKIHKSGMIGDVLVFLTGQDEIEQATSTLINYAQDLKKENMKLYVIPLHSNLPYSAQLKAFTSLPRTVRKVVVATNIAEASVTIKRINFVVDCCFVKMRYFNPYSCTDSLVVVPISQASAEQRAGRAGRLQFGKAFRLCTEEDFLKLPAYTVPEMQRSNLAPVILQLKALGIENILRFNFPSAPPSKHVISALELLFALGALDENGSLTSPLGENMAEFPLHPMFSKFLLISGEFGCTEEALTITAMLQVQNIFHHSAYEKKKTILKFAVEEGDFFTFLNIYNSFKKNMNQKWCDQHFLSYKVLQRAVEIRFQLSKLLKKFQVPIVPFKAEEDSLRKCIVSAFFANAAYLHYTGEYKTIRGDHTLHVHKDSVISLTKKPKCVVYNEVLHTTKEYMRDITAIEAQWLCEQAPHYYQYGTDREVFEKQET